MPTNVARYSLPLLLLAACASHDVSLATATTDTLPGGVVRVTSAGPTAWTPGHGWRLVRLPPLQPPSGSAGELINPDNLAVDAWGRIYVADNGPPSIKVYDSAGTWIRTIGREGDGPGEFRSAFVAVRGHLLLVHDPAAQRTSLFDTSGTFIRSFHSVGDFYDTPGLDARYRAVLPTLNMAGNGPPVARIYTRFDTLGALLDSLEVPQLDDEHFWSIKANGRTMMATVIPFAPRTIDVFGRDSGVVYGSTGHYDLVMSSGHRDSSRIMIRSWAPEPLPDSLRRARVDEMVDRYKKRFDETLVRSSFPIADVPTTAPAFTALVQDDVGRTWVVRPRVGDSTSLDVFDSAGVWLGSVTADLHGAGTLVPANGMFYSAGQTPDGLPVILRWRLDTTRTR